MIEIPCEQQMEENVKEKRCISCGAPLYAEPVLTLDNMPASAQNIPDAGQVKEDKGLTLNLCQCRGCGLVQFDCDPVWYYRDVIRSGGFSTTMVELRRNQYRHLIETYGLQGKKFIEVGCGQGEFLSVLAEFPADVYGMEHRKDLAVLARKAGLKVFEGFTEDEDTQIPEGPFDVFLSFNFLEHQPDPNGMLQAIYNNLTEDGMGLVTVPSLEYILQYDGFYELIRDHIAYFTFDTLRFLLERNGFAVLEQEMVNRDTISMIVKKKKRLDAAGLRDSFTIINEEVNGYIDHLVTEGKSIAIWGASHQGFTLAATTRLGEKVSYIIDSAPFKQGRFAPTSHLPIVAPDYFLEHPVDAILIVAPGYTAEIAGIIRERFGRHVQILALKSNHLEKLEEDR